MRYRAASMKATTQPSVTARVEMSKVPVVTMPEIIARMIQPIVSSTTAALSVRTPTSRRTRFRSIRILAITGMAERPIVVAMKCVRGRRPFST